MFNKAIPVFAEGKSKEKNYQLVLRAEVESLKNTTIYIAAFSFYRLTVNGNFVAFGPARTAGGYARVDSIDLGAYDICGKPSEILIEVAGYYCMSLSTVKQPSFVVAELRRGDEVILATGREGDFVGYRNCRRVQNVERYSKQRHFGEIWDFTASEPFSYEYRVCLTESEYKPVYLDRRVPKPTFDVVETKSFVSGGHYRYDELYPCQENRYSGNEMNEEMGQFYEPDLVSRPYRWIQKQHLTQTMGRGSLPIQIGAGEYVMIDLEKIEVGFLGLSMSADEESDVVLGYSELCSPNKFAFTNINCQNVIEYYLPEGKKVDVESFEPYSCRIAIVMVRKGSIRLNSFSVRKYEFDRSRLIPRDIRDPELRSIYKAAERTFVHNAVDLYTDCPSRERAGWLCDSFFTGRAEYFLTGRSVVEGAYLENFRLYKNGAFGYDLIDGALPMTYPADVFAHRQFIPQWNMWYVLEVKEYLIDRASGEDPESFKDSVYGILSYLSACENSDGLLQDLPSWNFVEWSSANDWTANVNYPTNFLYAEVLRSIAAIYGDDSLLEKAHRVAKKTEEFAFDGEVFVDNAVLDENGVLHNTRNVSEAGQYYALLFGEIDLNDKKYAVLKRYVDDGFTSFDPADREFVHVNAFIGLYLRICALMKLGKKEILKQDLKDFFGGMVASTGTLWEYKQFKGSFDHGFASLSALAIDFVENS